MFTTSDLGLAIALSLFIKIHSINKANPRKALFYFTKDLEVDELTELYWKGRLRVDPLAYFNQSRILKSQLYSRGE